MQPVAYQKGELSGYQIFNKFRHEIYFIKFNQTYLDRLMNITYFWWLMMKLLIRLILSLCILLSSGYGQLYAHKHLSNISHSLLAADQISAGFNHQDLPHIIKTTSSDTEKGIQINALDIEEEETEFSSSKKCQESSKVLTSIFHAFTSGFLFENIKVGLLPGKQFSNTSSYRWHLIIQVFRI